MFDGGHETELKGSWELAENRPGASTGRPRAATARP
jgi:hypothetical protein